MKKINTSPISGTQELLPKAQAIFNISQTSVAYNGLPQSAEISVVPSFTPFSVTYNNDTTLPTKSGIYQAAITINDTNILGDTSFIFEIQKPEYQIIISDTHQIYDGNAKNISTSILIDDSIANYTQHISYFLNDSINIPSPIDAGVYEARITAFDITCNGITYNDTLKFTTTLFIEKATAEIIFYDSLSHIYDGNAKRIEVKTIPENLPLIITYNGDTTAPIEIGNYLVEATIIDKNYQGSNTCTFTILDNTNISNYNDNNITINISNTVQSIPRIGLSESPMVEGRLSVNEMTYGEIVEAGIDVDAPGNNHVFKYDDHISISDFLQNVILNPAVAKTNDTEYYKQFISENVAHKYFELLKNIL